MLIQKILSNFISNKRSLRPEGLRPSRGIAPSGFRPLRNILHCCLPQELEPCLSFYVADHPLKPATDHRLGKLLSYQLANQTQNLPSARNRFKLSLLKALAAVSGILAPKALELLFLSEG